VKYEPPFKHPIEGVRQDNEKLRKHFTLCRLACIFSRPAIKSTAK
jgi:hypothetical protein